MAIKHKGTQIYKHIRVRLNAARLPISVQSTGAAQKLYSRWQMVRNHCTTQLVNKLLAIVKTLHSTEV